MATPASLLDLIAHGGSLRASQDNSQQLAQTAQTQANTGITNAQLPLVRQQTREAALKNQVVQQQLNDQDIIRRGYVSTAGLAPEQVPEAVRQFAMKNGISSPGYQNYELHSLGLREKAAALTKADRDNLDATHQQAGEIINTIDSEADPAKRLSLYRQQLPNLQRLAPDAAWKPAEQLQPDDLKMYIGMLGHTKAILGQKKEVADVNKLNADTENAAADAKKKNAMLPGDLAAQDTQNQQAARVLAGTSPTGVTAEAGQREFETNRHNKATEAAAKAEHGLAAQKFAMEFGGDAVKGWAATIAQNPDAAGSVPAALRTGVQQQFTKDTGLPFPKPLTGSAVDQERAARNTLDKVPRIQELLADPEVSSRSGSILGRLGNVEQAVGTAVGLSPAGEAKAQELRTLMRYMVFGEGKAVLGGRLPKDMMAALEASSPNVHMDPGTMNGAMKAVEESANDALDNADKQRFGGQMRSREARSVGSKPKMIRARDPLGKLHEAPAGTALPEGWKKE